MGKINGLFHLLFRTNLLKTLLLNFSMFPLKQALRLPIFVYGKANFRSLKGEIIIKAPLHRGMIKIGKPIYLATSVPLSTWTINGKLIFHGPINFLQGTYLMVAKNAELSFGSKGTFVGSDSKIICFEKISIGNQVRITWECQIMDTSFHYIEDAKGRTPGLTKEVRLGNDLWIGNRSTLMKGTVLPDKVIVASNSLLNKDYSDYAPYTLFAGQPAKARVEGVRRIFDKEVEKELDQKYGYVRTLL